MDEKLFELFWIKNDFANSFEKCCNIFKHFALHNILFSQNNKFHYYRVNRNPCGAEFYEMFFWHQSKSLNFVLLNLVFSASLKMVFVQLFPDKEINNLEIVDNVFII